MVVVSKVDIDRSSGHSARCLRDRQSQASSHQHQGDSDDSGIALLPLTSLTAALSAGVAPSSSSSSSAGKRSPYRQSRGNLPSTESSSSASSIPALFPLSFSSPRLSQHKKQSEPPEQSTSNATFMMSPTQTPRRKRGSSKSKKFAAFLLEQQRRPSGASSSATAASTMLTPTASNYGRKSISSRSSATRSRSRTPQRKTIKSDRQLAISSTFLLEEQSLLPPLNSSSASSCVPEDAYLEEEGGRGRSSTASTASTRTMSMGDHDDTYHRHDAQQQYHDDHHYDEMESLLHDDHHHDHDPHEGSNSSITSKSSVSERAGEDEENHDATSTGDGGGPASTSLSPPPPPPLHMTAESALVRPTRSSFRYYIRFLLIAGLIVMHRWMTTVSSSSGNDFRFNHVESTNSHSNNAATTTTATTTTTSTTPKPIPYKPTWDEINASPTFSEFCSRTNKPNVHLAPLVDKHNVKSIILQNDADRRYIVAKEYAMIDESNVTTAFTQQFVDGIQTKYQTRTFLMKATHTSGCITKVVLGNDDKDTQFTCFKQPCLQQQEDTTQQQATTHQKLQQLCQLYLQQEYSDKFHEEFYRNIPKRCILEEYLLDNIPNNQKFQDYKVHTFHGRPMIVQVMSDRYHSANQNGGGGTRNTRTPDWHEIPLAINRNKHDTDPNLGSRPDDVLDIVLNATKRLYDIGNEYLRRQQNNHTFSYVRMDFFVYDGSKVAFAEMTFTHKSCGTLFDNHDHNWANQFYGYVGEHPEYDIAPNLILDYAAERKRGRKRNGGGKHRQL